MGAASGIHWGRRLGAHAAAAVALVSLAGPGAQAAAPAPSADFARPPQHTDDAAASYERWRAPTVLEPDARAVLHQVRLSNQAGGRAFAFDWRLARASQGMLAWAATRADGPFALDQLRALAWNEGWTDGELAGVAVDAAPAELAAAVGREVRALLADGAELDQIGVALSPPRPTGPAQLGAGEGGRADNLADRAGASLQTAVVALSRRRVQLAPVPRRQNLGGVAVLSGRLVDAKVRQASLALAYPNGEVRRVPLPLAHGAFHLPVPVGHREGTLQVQLLLERRLGPEIAAEFPLFVGDSARSAPVPAAAGDNLHSSLLSLLYGLRRAHNLPLPVPVASLMLVARQHAADMAAHHFFAHVSRRTGNVTHRLAAVHQPFLHVVENLAEGADAQAVFGQWLRSPSHLLNLLDPRVDAVGLASVAGDAEAPTVAVLVMAALPPP